MLSTLMCTVTGLMYQPLSPGRSRRDRVADRRTGGAGRRRGDDRQREDETERDAPHAAPSPPVPDGDEPCARPSRHGGEQQCNAGEDRIEVARRAHRAGCDQRGHRDPRQDVPRGTRRRRPMHLRDDRVLHLRMGDRLRRSRRDVNGTRARRRRHPRGCRHGRCLAPRCLAPGRVPTWPESTAPDQGAGRRPRRPAPRRAPPPPRSAVRIAAGAHVQAAPSFEPRSLRLSSPPAAYSSPSSTAKAGVGEGPRASPNQQPASGQL